MLKTDYFDAHHRHKWQCFRIRLVDKVLKRSLKGHGAVLIEGPKWCGKTTSAIKHCNSKLFLSNINQYMKAKALLDIDVRQVLKGEPPLLIDEWQFIPELWDSIRFEIDMRQSVGQFILTGSTIPFDKSQLHRNHPITPHDPQIVIF